MQHSKKQVKQKMEEMEQFRIKVQQKINEQDEFVQDFFKKWQDAERVGNEQDAQKYRKMHWDEQMYKDGLVEALRIFDEEAQKMSKLEIELRKALYQCIKRREEYFKNNQTEDWHEEIHSQVVLWDVLKSAGLDPHIEFNPDDYL